MKARLVLSTIIGCSLAMITLVPGRAQETETPSPAETANEDEASEKKDESAKDEDKKKEEEKPKTIAEVTKDSDRIEGLFTLFRDRKTGDLRLLLRADQLDRKFLHFSYVENGVVAAGVFRGMFGDVKVFSVRRYFNRAEVVVENSRFYVAPELPIARAAGANTTHAVVADEKIEAEDEAQGLLLVNAGSIFLRETFGRITPLPDPKKPPHEVFTPGALNASKSKIRTVRNYPQNTDIVVEYVFENEKPYVGGGEAQSDDRFVSVLVQHSLIAAPTEAFTPRFDDPRIGYFSGRITDLGATTDVTPYRDPIMRWRLVKQDPAAPVSPPVEPIVFWIENTTPLELRPVIERAALLWNEAFLAAGFQDALQIKTQPDDADWDAGDIRYNVIRWTASPTPVFGGYGPAFFDPRDGRILGADIMLEYDVIGGIVNNARTLGPDAAPPAIVAKFKPGLCQAAACARAELGFAHAALETLGADTAERQRMLEEFIHYLVLHEIGHTLGLMHNFRSSHLHSLDDVYNAGKTSPVGLTGSVMDYPQVPFAPPGRPQGGYWPARPGPYDIWAITFGYAPALDDLAAETNRLESLLARSTEPALAFGNDADAMHWPGKALDPRVLANDMSADPIGFARDQILVVDAAVPKFQQRLTKPGESYQLMLNGTMFALARYHASAAAAARFVGGVHVDRAMVDQPGATTPLNPVKVEDQRRALQLLREKIFAPEAFAFLHAHADRLIGQRRGFDHFPYTEDPKLHDAVLWIQRDVLDHLLHPVVLKRLTDTRIYGNGYSAHALLTELSDAIFAADLRGDVNTLRQNLQLEFTKRLLSMVDPAKENPYDSIAQSAALDRLRWIQAQLGTKAKANAETAAHRAHVLYRIARGLDETRR